MHSCRPAAWSRWHRRLSLVALVALLLPPLGIVSTAAPATPVAPSKEIKPLFDVTINHEFPKPRETFDEVLKLVQANYYTDQLDEKSLWWGAIQGLLRQLDCVLGVERFGSDDVEQLLGFPVPLPSGDVVMRIVIGKV